jgi:hypothetical protein
MTTYQGETLADLTSQLEYVNWALSHELENWERKEFQEVKSELLFKISTFND